MKWISLIVILNFAAISEDIDPFRKYVFKKANIKYLQSSKTIELPDTNIDTCTREVNPQRIKCAIDGTFSDVFLTEGHKLGDFDVTVLNQREKGINTTDSVSVSSFVKNGKVKNQSTCFYRQAYRDGDNEKKTHAFITKLDCYVITPKMCELIGDMKSQDLKSEKIFSSFVDILKSDEYKQELIKAYKYNYRNIFLSENKKHNRAYYDKLKYAYYDVEREKDSSKSLTSYENDEQVQQSKVFMDLIRRSGVFLKKVFYLPCKNLLENNLLYGVEKEYVDRLDQASGNQVGSR